MKRVIVVLVIFIFSIGGMHPVFASTYLNKENVSIIINGVKVKTEQSAIWSKSRLLVPARSVFKNLGATVEWYAESGLIEVTKEKTSIKMKLGDNNATVNNVNVKVEAPPVLSNGTLMVPVRLVAENLKAKVNWDGVSRSIQITDKSFSPSISRGESERKFVVAIDPGHGGSEPGAIYGGTKEKDLNLAIAKELNSLLMAAGIKTVMTRTNDTYVGLYKRSDIANNAKADLLISIHNNADTYKGTKGSMSLYYPYGGNAKGNLTAKEFASIVQKQLTGKLDTINLGVIQRPHLAVLRTAKMPAVLAEVGYMSNSSELNRLKSTAFRKSAAEALKNAVLKALDEI